MRSALIWLHVGGADAATKACVLRAALSIYPSLDSDSIGR